ncbi:MAG: molybdopterin-binding protein [Pseudomonadota bacterium]
MTNAASTSPTAALMIVGNEILSGRTKDANLAYLGEKLGAVGIQMREARVVPDIDKEIITTVRALSARYTYVFSTGGIGPTHDDITAACIAEAFGTVLERNPEAEAMLRSHYDDPAKLTEARLKMAEVPVGAELIANPVSKAPGFRLANVYVMAGVPKIMQAMLDNILPTLEGGKPFISRTVTGAVREGDIAGGLGALQAEHPDLDIGSYPYYQDGKFGTSIVVRGLNETEIDEVVDRVVQLMEDLGVSPSAVG